MTHLTPPPIYRTHIKIKQDPPLLPGAFPSIKLFYILAGNLEEEKTHNNTQTQACTSDIVTGI